MANTNASAEHPISNIPVLRICQISKKFQVLHKKKRKYE